MNRLWTWVAAGGKRGQILTQEQLERREKRRCGRSFVYIGLSNASANRLAGRLNFCRMYVLNAAQHREFARENGHYLP